MAPPQSGTAASPDRLTALQHVVWSGSVALEIRLAASDCRTFDVSEPYLVQFPRLSYLAFLLPRMHAFFASSLINPDVAAHEAWLEFDGVPLKWHYPLGLLYDLFSGSEPFAPKSVRQRENAGFDGDRELARECTSEIWKLRIHYTDFPYEQLIALDAEGLTMRDWFVNAVKEADFIRNGSARPVMSLGRQDSDNLWQAVLEHDVTLFNSIHSKLLNPPGYELRHIPAKFYLPAFAAAVGPGTHAETIAEETDETTAASTGHFRVVQALVPLRIPGSKAIQTLGSALNAVLPTVFPSRRNPLLAQPVLHGAIVPMSAHLQDLSRGACYTDGFMHIVIAMLV